MGLIFSGQTDVGKIRSSNQDSIYMNQNLHLYIVADGMGGHNGGDIASQTAVKSIPEYFMKNSSAEPLNLLKSAILYANESILDMARKNKKLQGMGTTIVCMLFRESTLYVANVGDSRAYLINKGQLFQLSRDHSLVYEKLHLGLYTRSEASKDKMKNILVRTVGFDENVEIDIYTYKISKNDIFFICSDGIHSKVSERDILYIINKNIPDPSLATVEITSKTVKDLIDQANNNGGQDNSSVILTVTQ